MKIATLIIVIVLGQQYFVTSQTLSPKVSASAGGHLSGNGSSISFTLGETFFTTLENGNLEYKQGFQHPAVQLRIINLSVFIQGFYTGAGLMSNCLNISGVSTDPLDADSVQISIMKPNVPYSLVESRVGILKTNGDVTVQFSPEVVANNTYYIKINHRNSIETWSKNPVLLTASTSYSFISNPAQAFGDNETATFDNLYYAIYSGDINHDGAVDGADFLELDPSIQAGDGGYQIGDLNGDGAVDGADFLTLDPNIQNGVGAAVP